jgi:hypothetical protein
MEKLPTKISIYPYKITSLLFIRLTHQLTKLGYTCHTKKSKNLYDVSMCSQRQASVYEYGFKLLLLR